MLEASVAEKLGGNRSSGRKLLYFGSNWSFRQKYDQFEHLVEKFWPKIEFCPKTVILVQNKILSKLQRTNVLIWYNLYGINCTYGSVLIFKTDFQISHRFDDRDHGLERVTVNDSFILRTIFSWVTIFVDDSNNLLFIHGFDRWK